jgi:hypothetical protein
MHFYYFNFNHTWEKLFLQEILIFKYNYNVLLVY